MCCLQKILSADFIRFMWNLTRSASICVFEKKKKTKMVEKLNISE